MMRPRESAAVPCGILRWLSFSSCWPSVNGWTENCSMSSLQRISATLESCSGFIVSFPSPIKAIARAAPHFYLLLTWRRRWPGLFDNQTRLYACALLCQREVWKPFVSSPLKLSCTLFKEYTLLAPLGDELCFREFFVVTRMAIAWTRFNVLRLSLLNASVTFRKAQFFGMGGVGE